MKDYYQILGVNKSATTEEIDNTFNKIKKMNQLTTEINNVYHILNDKTKRKIYDELYNKIKSLSSFKIPFFGYDFDEKYISSFEQKRYLIDDNRYLIYEKENKNGNIIKNYYIEHNGKLEVLSENNIKKLKQEYYERKSLLLKDSLLNKVLPK
jgi:DnaJ-class molecular chaperone